MTKKNKVHRLENPRETIIAKTKELIQLNSYKSVTFDIIAKELNIKKPSVIYHFPSKDELGLEVIKSYRKQIQEEIKNLEYYTDNPLTKLKNYFRFFSNAHRTLVGMCPAGVMAVEVNTISDTLKAEIREFFKENFSWLEKNLEEAKTSNKIEFEGSVKERVYLIESAIQGGLMLARLDKDSDIFWGVLRQLKNDLHITEKWSITPKDVNDRQIII